MKVDQLVQSLGKAMQESFKNLELYGIDAFLGGYFTEQREADGSVTYTPRQIVVRLPGDKERLALAPVAALAHHQNMNLDYVKVKLNVEVSSGEDALDVDACAAQEQGVRQVGEVELMFRRGETAEGVARLEEQLNKFL